ncbi:olfactory receptor 4E1-like [Takifugu flavidus]|uniref:olfactory receptor 4E1-like n=1 Tax=Takifugu flavidus TaxID=433684 RepID=UPI0025449F71|nr:olfactory receptor 4E1-like [Takifugu flavidus]
MPNRSSIVVFSLSGFNATVKYRNTLFALTFLCYFLIIVVNICLILTIIIEKKLHEPMYIFLGSLCFNGLYGATGFYPKFLSDLLSDDHLISRVGCFVQIYVIYSNTIIDYSILVVMAYDRYVAICRPLEYHCVMSKQNTVLLLGLSWLVPLCCETLVISLSSSLELCGSHIDKLYCENWAVVKLACGATTANDIVGMVLIVFYFCHVLLIASSYVQLVKATLKSTEGRKKFMQTCLPHLCCLFNVTASLLFDLMYSRYGSVSLPQHLRNFMAIQFLIITPVLNPIIYGLKLTNIRNTMRGYICQ